MFVAYSGCVPNRERQAATVQQPERLVAQSEVLIPLHFEGFSSVSPDSRYALIYKGVF